jgi:hypothetical protein
MSRTTAAAVLIVVVPLVVYPMWSMAGGSPRFPSRDECIRSVVEGEPVDLVYGRYDDPESAAAARDRVVAVGFTGTEVLFDGCGRWKVVLEGVPSVDIAREIQSEAATVGLHPTLERAAGT